MQSQKTGLVSRSDFLRYVIANEKLDLEGRLLDRRHERRLELQLQRLQRTELQWQHDAGRHVFSDHGFSQEEHVQQQWQLLPAPGKLESEPELNDDDDDELEPIIVSPVKTVPHSVSLAVTPIKSPSFADLQEMADNAALFL